MNRRSISKLYNLSPHSFLRTAALFSLLLSLLLCSCSPHADTGGQGTGGQGRTQEQVSDAGQGRTQEQSSQAGQGRTREQSSQAAPTIESVRLAAQQLSDKYKIRILCGSDVPLSYADYTAGTLEDPVRIDAALHELDSTLSIYPPEFFATVKEGYCDSITICLAKDLYAASDAFIESANAFTTVEDGTIWLVLNAGSRLRRGTLIHELTHVTDYRLLGMNQMEETEWNLLNPPSFSYYNAYLDDMGTDLRISGSREYTALAEEEADRIWFFDSYSKTFAMEDRARLMETLLQDSGDLAAKKCFSSPHIQAKLRFYFYTLRQAFENGRWPEETVWEAKLHEAVQ